ncbi:flavodoxin family protein [Loigolactobacillus binensis]|uniref:Flavodoxin family protein n=1 Tax=Loigolactobacillus binensis TaxID=2559922 RepID=A0ABW3E8J9_9LACO|nr:flavodoxin domain-containing protein [Loigolactobacillus binensis]
MKIAVRYYSRGGNAKKVAEAIAQAAGVVAKDCSVPVAEPVDLLFLGGSVYWAGLDKHFKQFIAQLDPAMVKHAATFGTSALKKDLDKEADKLMQAKNISVATRSFRCWGEFAAVHKGHPDATDLQQAAVFAQTVMAELK